MSEDSVSVEPARSRGWKATLRRPKVWIPVVSVVVVVGVVGAVAANAAIGKPLASANASETISASPHPTGSATPALSGSPSASPSESPSAAASAPPAASSSASPSPSASPTNEWVQTYDLDGADYLLGIKWTPDSRYVAVSGTWQESGETGNLAIVDAASSEIARMDACGYPLAWSHTGNRLAAVACGGDGDRVLRILDTAATTKAKLTLTGAEKVRALAWSANDNTIVYTSSPRWDANGSSVMSLNLGTGAVTTLDVGGLLSASPAGDRIAYWADEDGDGVASALVVSNFDGSQRRVLQKERSSATLQQPLAPEWAPDGSALAYRYDDTADATTTWNVYEFNGGGAVQLMSVNKPSGYGQIRWAPDAEKLLVSFNRSALAVSREGDLLAKERVTSQLYPETRWSSDGESVLLSYHSGKPNQTWHVSEDWRETTPGTDELEPDGPSVISPDGTMSAWAGHHHRNTLLTLVVQSPE